MLQRFVLQQRCSLQKTLNWPIWQLICSCSYSHHAPSRLTGFREDPHTEHKLPRFSNTTPAVSEATDHISSGCSALGILARANALQASTACSSRALNHTRQGSHCVNGKRQHSSWLPGWLQKRDSSGPQAQQRPEIRTAHGPEWVDEYSWMETGGRALQRHLAREASHLDEVMRPHRALQHTVLREMLAVLPNSVETDAERVGEWEYFTRQTPAAPAVCFLRRPAGDRAAGAGAERASPEQIVLDGNELARLHGSSEVGQVKLSRDHAKLAFTLESGSGDETYTGYIQRVGAGPGEDLEVLEGVASLEWAADGETLLYTVPDTLGRPHRAFRRRLGDPVGEGTLLLEEEDERCFVELGRTKDWAFLTVNVNSKLSSEVWLLSCKQPSAPLRLVRARRPGVEYFVEHWRGVLLLLTNAGGGGDYDLAVADPEDPAGRPWRVCLPASRSRIIEDMEVFHSGCVLYTRDSHGRQQVSIVRLPDDPRSLLEGDSPPELVPEAVALPEWATCVTAGANQDYHSPTARLMLSSPVHPEEAYDLCLERATLAPVDYQHKRTAKHKTPLAEHKLDASQAESTREGLAEMPARREGLASGRGMAADAGSEREGAAGQRHNPDQYECSRLMVPSASDGEQIPLTVVHSHSTQLDGSAPLLLIGYGAYGQSQATGFEPRLLPLLQRSWVVAWAHVRGGGELGRRWHEAGRLLQKQQSADDMSDCLDFLLARGYSSRGRIAVEGTSAGGMLAGALLNRRPDVLGAAVLRVPFVDVLTAMSLPDLPLTMHEYDEWGDPRDVAAWQKISEVCPYHNLRPAHYPPILATCAVNDARVPYWGPAKWVARLRARQLGPAPVLLQVQQDSGHFGRSEEAFEGHALECAFLLAHVESGRGARWLVATRTARSTDLLEVVRSGWRTTYFRKLGGIQIAFCHVVD